MCDIHALISRQRELIYTLTKKKKWIYTVRFIQNIQTEPCVILGISDEYLTMFLTFSSFFSMFLTLFQINLIFAKFPSKFATTHRDDRGLVTFRKSTDENFREHSDQTLSRETTDENFQKHSDHTLSSEISGKMPRTISFTRYNVPNLSIIYRWPLFSEVVVGDRHRRDTWFRDLRWRVSRIFFPLFPTCKSKPRMIKKQNITEQKSFLLLKIRYERRQPLKI